MPAAMAAAIGGRLADTSLGAIRIASGLAAVTDSMIGFCSVAWNWEGPGRWGGTGRGFWAWAGRPNPWGREKPSPPTPGMNAILEDLPLVEPPVAGEPPAALDELEDEHAAAARVSSKTAVA